MLDINGGEIIVLLVLAVVLIGPERLPRYAAQLATLVRRGKVMLQDAKARVDDELGPELKDVDWSKLDPRQYDPRRIVREALLDDDPVPTRAPAAGAAGAAAGNGAATNGAATNGAAGNGAAGNGAAGNGKASATASSTSASAPAAGPAPFDDEAT